MIFQISSKWLFSIAIFKIELLTFYASIASGRVYGAALSETNIPARPVCVYYMSASVKSQNDTSDEDKSEKFLDANTVQCSSPADYCFSFWSTNITLDDGDISSDMPGFKWLARGCFKNAHSSCMQEKCVSVEKEMAENSYFCCCKGDKCNENVSLKQKLIQLPPKTPVTDGTEDGNGLTTCLIIIGSILTLLILSLYIIYVKRRRLKKMNSDSSLPFDKSPTSPCIDINNLIFMEEIGRGRYGTVRRALLGDEEVAVKLFSMHHKSSFLNEKYIYSLPLMHHENLLSFLGGGEIVGPDKNPYLGLVLSYCPRGKLSSFLQQNTLDWYSFCTVVISLARGLGHLHSDDKKGDLVKPCIAHRDFNTRNILLRSDMTCVVSDLGFAIHTQGARFYVNGEEQLAEMASLTDVGTLRYMAPEVLEGAVNLRDCETSLKQIDIYALGLVLWEIASRCHDLYQGTPSPQYALPFEAEIGLHPSFEHMQVLVARNKARPLFPSIWKDSNPAIRQLKETIGDCWDNDAEARLSAMCVEKRLMELNSLWDRFKNSMLINGISPSTNSSGGGGSNPQTKPCVDSFMISNELNLFKFRKEGSVSENTNDTNIPFTPSDIPVRNLDKNHYVEPMPVPTALQPYQGRNPCIERNTVNEFLVENNNPEPLVEASDKFHYPEFGTNSVNLAAMLEAKHGLDSNLLKNEQLMPLLNCILPASQQQVYMDQAMALPPQPLNYPPINVPVSIPYLQNETRITNPKQQNNPNPNLMSNSFPDNNKSSGVLKKFKAVWDEKVLALLPHRKHRSGNHYQGDDEEHQNILSTPTPGGGFSGPPTPLAPFNQHHSSLTPASMAIEVGHLGDYQRTPGNLSNPPQQQKPPVLQQHETEVRFSQGVPLTSVVSSNPRPNNIDIQNTNNEQVNAIQSEANSQVRGLPNSQVRGLPYPYLSSRLMNEKQKLAAVIPTPNINMVPPPSVSSSFKSGNGSKDSGINKSSENSSGGASSTDFSSSHDNIRRPTTLVLKHKDARKKNSKKFLSLHPNTTTTSDEDEENIITNTNSQNSSVTNSSSGEKVIKLRKPKQRIKTPRNNIPAEPRLSLYDDSDMMSKVKLLLEDNSIDGNLSQSLPMDMDTVGTKSTKKEVEKPKQSSSQSIKSTNSSSENSSSINNINQKQRFDSTSSGNSTSESSVGLSNELLSQAHLVKVNEAKALRVVSSAALENL